MTEAEIKDLMQKFADIRDQCTDKIENLKKLLKCGSTYKPEPDFMSKEWVQAYYKAIGEAKQNGLVEIEVFGKKYKIKQLG